MDAGKGEIGQVPELPAWREEPENAQVFAYRRGRVDHGVRCACDGIGRARNSRGSNPCRHEGRLGSRDRGLALPSLERLVPWPGPATALAPALALAPLVIAPSRDAIRARDGSSAAPASPV